MKRFQKWLALALCLTMALSLAACGGQASSGGASGEEAQSGGEENAESDLQYVHDKGTLVVGITEFEPMDYQDADGNWIGFDADMAAAFAESLGVEAQFQLINWDSKVFELNGKSIDVVWNGMTLTDEVRNSMECSNPYFNNAQVVVTSADRADSLLTVDDVSGLSYAVEAGSAGMEVAEANGFTYTEVVDQATALLEVASGTADAAIIDFLMAKAMIGEGTSYENLGISVQLNSEEYGVGFRTGSDLAAALNDFFKTSYADGSMQAAAEKYNIAEALVAQE